MKEKVCARAIARDRGTNLSLCLMQNELLGIKKLNMMANHPQCNGMVTWNNLIEC